MKKITSLLIAVLMIVSTAAMIVPAGATSAAHTLDENNVAIDVPYFSGTTNFYEISGKSTDRNKLIEPLGSINISNKRGSGVLNLDGTITEAEWGVPIVEVDKNYAATLKGMEPSEENTYFWHVSQVVNAQNKLEWPKGYNPDGEFSYKVWMAWDEDYLYVAAKVKDPDGFFANQPDEDIWNGDCLQFIIDPDGPNSIAGGSGYNPKEQTTPWATRADSWRKDPDNDKITWRTSKVCNIGMGYLGGDGGVEMFDMENRYFPKYEPVYDASGNVDYMTVNWKQYEIAYNGFDKPGEESQAPNPLEGDKYAYAAVLPKAVSRTQFETTYEAAIPWELVSGSYIEYDYKTQKTTPRIVAPNPKAGDEYGISMVVLDGARGEKEYNSWLTWGSGVCRAQTESSDYGTAGGSNSMVLVSDELGTIGCDHTFADATCTAPYTCTKCGYKKGFKTGHHYKSEIVTPLSATDNGVIKATCQTCGDVQNITVPVVEQVITAECPAKPVVAPPLPEDSEWYSAGWTTVYKDERNNDAVIKNPDGTDKTTYQAINGEMVFDLSDSEAGTYFQTFNGRGSFAYKYSFRLTDTYDTHFSNYVHKKDPTTGEELPNEWEKEKASENYVQGLYHWFGGIFPESDRVNYGLSYAAGFFPDAAGSLSGTFKIMEAHGSVIIPKNLEESGSPQQWVFCETDNINLGTGWHDVIFVFDEAVGAAFYYLDGECIMAAWDEGMKMDGNEQVSIIRKMEVPCMIKDLGLGSTTAFFENTGFKVKCDGEVIGTFAPGSTVTLPVPANKLINRCDARFFTWEGAKVTRGKLNPAATTANKRTYTMVMPSNDVELTSKFVILGDANADDNLTVKDVAQMKKFLSSAVVPTDVQSEAADINLDGLVNQKDLQLLKKKFA